MNETVLRDTLRYWRRSAHIYGMSDCLLSIADYGRDLCGFDVGARWRGTYSTEAEAQHIVSEAGGPVPLLGGALLAGGFVSTVGLERGYPVVARMLGKDFGGIWLGDGRCAFRLERGLLELRLPATSVLGAWQCPQL